MQEGLLMSRPTIARWETLGLPRPPTPSPPAPLVSCAMPLKIAVCVAGGGSSLLALLESLRNFGGAKVVLVLSNRASAGGLGHAKAFGVPAVVFRNPADGAEWLGALHQAHVALIVL